MRPQDAIDGWEDVETAEMYARFARSHDMYRRTSADLVERTEIVPDSVVVDLCGGTGVTAAVVLDRLGFAGRVHSLDLSPAMQAVGRRELPDRRVTWTTSRAEDVARVVTPGVDAVVCNSAIWKTDLAATLDGVSTVLRPGGQFTFNVGGGFAGLPRTSSGRSGPSLNSLIEQVAGEEFGYRLSGRREHGPTLSAAYLEGALDSAGLKMLSAEAVSHLAPLVEKRDWLSIPIFSRPAGFRDYETRMRILERVWERVDRDASYATDWLVVRAVRRG